MKLISDTAEYALRAVVWLAQQPDHGQTTQQIADGTHTPADYLSKVLQQLARAKLVRGQRGLGGGFHLIRPPHEITILEVINAVDPIERIHTCPLGLKAHGTHLCPLHRGLDTAMQRIEEGFASSTLADLLDQPETSYPGCVALLRQNTFPSTKRQK